MKSWQRVKIRQALKPMKNPFTNSYQICFSQALECKEEVLDTPELILKRISDLFHAALEEQRLCISKVLSAPTERDFDDWLENHRRQANGISS